MQGNNGNAQKNYRLKFVKFIKEKNYVEFQIRLICLEDDRLNVEFFERYSNLREYHEIFKKESGSINFPKFPPKKYIGSTDDKFLSQRQTGLEVYFDAVLGSREFSGLPSLRKWVDNLIKKYNKGSKTSTSVIEPTRHVEQVVQHVAPRNDIQKWKEVVDKYSKNFIDLGIDNHPHFDLDDCLQRENNYRKVLNANNIFNSASSKIIKIVPGDNSHFECLGLEEPKIAKNETIMMNKLSSVSKLINTSIPEDYVVQELISKLNISKRN